MSKKRKFELVDISNWPNERVSEINWELCVVCQKDVSKPLINPTVAGLKSLATNLTEFAQHNALPATVRFDLLDDGSGLLQSLQNHNAKYHKTCRSKYDAQKICRLSNSENIDNSIESHELKHSRNLRSACEAVDVRCVCLFCDLGDTANNRLSIYAFSHMNDSIQKLWIDFGVGKYRRIIAIHEINDNMPRSIAYNLPFFHAFTGCDTVSTFCGIGKKTAWKAWMNFRDVDQSFLLLSTMTAITDDTLYVYKTIGRFVVLMYDRSSPCEDINACRRCLYTKKNRAIENIPPTFDALLQHTKRAALQAHIWCDCLTANNASPYDFAQWGWKPCDDGGYEPVWCTLPEVAAHCSELVKCSCKTVCSNCKCRKRSLPCTKLCGCDGKCSGSASAAVDDIADENNNELTSTSPS